MKPKFRLRSKFKRLVDIQKHIMSILYKKRKFAHNSVKNAWNTKIVNDIVYNKKTKIVSIFKDCLISNDSTEYLKRCYSALESTDRIIKICYNLSSIQMCPLFRAHEPLTILIKGIKRKRECELEFERRLMRRLRFGLKNEDFIFDDNLKKSIDNIQPMHDDFEEDNKEMSSSKSLVSLFNLLRTSINEIKENSAKAPVLAKSSTSNKYKLFKNIYLTKPSASQANLHNKITSKISASNLNANSIKLPISPSNRRSKNKETIPKISIINPPSIIESEKVKTDINIYCKDNQSGNSILTKETNCTSLLRTQRNIQSEILPLITNQCTFTNSSNSIPNSQNQRENTSIDNTDKSPKIKKVVKSKFYTFDNSSPADAVKLESPTKLKVPVTFRKNSSISIHKIKDSKLQANLVFNSQSIAKRFSILPSKTKNKSSSVKIPNEGQV